LRWVLLYLPLLLLLAALGVGFWAWRTVEGLGRVEVGAALASPSGTARNYLLVGSDSRAGIDESTPNVGAIGTDIGGNRSDTIIVLRIDGSTATMMSIPRDLWVTDAETGKAEKINAAYNRGPANLIRTVSSTLGIEVHHYVEIDFVSFSGMVDAMGGITIDFPHPASDRNSGLLVPESGRQRLDGTQALAYVRSRRYVEEIDGVAVRDPTADLGRQTRQQNFIRAVLGEVGDTRNPVTAVRLVGAASTGVRVDQVLGVSDVMSLARGMSGAEPETVVLPTRPARQGKQAVLELIESEAPAVLARFKK